MSSCARPDARCGRRRHEARERHLACLRPLLRNLHPQPHVGGDRCAAARDLPRPLRPPAPAGLQPSGIWVGRRLQRVRAGPAGPARHVRRSGGRFQPDRGAESRGDRAVAGDAGQPGRAVRDMFSIVVQSLILILISLPFGLSIHPIGVVITLGLIALIGLLTASIAYAVALWARDENTYAPLIFTSTLPILLLSGVLLPLGLAPQWLRNIAAANPLSYAVDAARAVFNDHLGDPSVVKGVAIAAVLGGFAGMFAVRSLGR